MTAYTVAGRRGRWTFDTATLLARGAMRGGTLHTPAGDFDLESTDRRHLGVVARAGGRPVVTLHPDGARVPGPGEPARWDLGRHSGTLTRAGARIHVQAGWPGAPLRVEVTGTWAELELVVLTACFAVLTRRRQRLITAAVIAGAIGDPGRSGGCGWCAVRPVALTGTVAPRRCSTTSLGACASPPDRSWWPVPCAGRATAAPTFAWTRHGTARRGRGMAGTTARTRPSVLVRPGRRRQT